jgi:hypothetical protein
LSQPDLAPLRTWQVMYRGRDLNAS